MEKAWVRINRMRKFKFLLHHKSLKQFIFLLSDQYLNTGMLFGIIALSKKNRIAKRIQIEEARIVTGTTKLVSINSLYEETAWEIFSKHDERIISLLSSSISPQYLSDLVPATIDSSSNKARSQAEARKPGLQHHMGIDTRNPDFS